jgi:hypothetical protein
MKNTRWLSPQSETQIVALLLLFFLAHMAFGECGNFQAEVRFQCKLTNPKLTKPFEWNEKTNDASECVNLPWSFLRHNFSRETAAVVHKSLGTNLVTYASDSSDAAISTIYSGVHPGDLLIGFQIAREPKGDAQAIVFIKTVETEENFTVNTLKGRTVLKSEPVVGDSGTVTLTSPHQSQLTCTYTVKTLNFIF